MVTAALLATNFWEPAARALEGWQPSYTYVFDFIVLWGLFAVFMIVLRVATDFLSPVKVRFIKLAERIYPYVHPDLEHTKAGNLTTYLELTTAKGARYERRLTTHQGHPDDPLSDQEMETKFRRCASLRLSEAKLQAACEAIWSLDKLNTLEPLLTAIAG